MHIYICGLSHINWSPDPLSSNGNIPWVLGNIDWEDKVRERFVGGDFLYITQMFDVIKHECQTLKHECSSACNTAFKLYSYW